MSWLKHLIILNLNEELLCLVRLTISSTLWHSVPKYDLYPQSISVYCARHGIKHATVAYLLHATHVSISCNKTTHEKTFGSCVEFCNSESQGLVLEYNRVVTGSWWILYHLHSHRHRCRHHYHHHQSQISLRWEPFCNIQQSDCCVVKLIDATN
jgi:hypothetical protein